MDELGGLEAAIAKAKKLAKVEEVSVINYPTKSTFFDSLLNEMQGTSYADQQLKQALGEYYPIWAELKNVGQKTGIQTALPYYLKFNL